MRGGQQRNDAESETLIPIFGGVFDVVHALRGEGFDASEDDTGRDTPIVPFAIQAGALRENPSSGPDGVGVQEHIAYTLEARAEVQAIAFQTRGSNLDTNGEISGTLGTNSNSADEIRTGMRVRRLTPMECERLQGFPDGYTDILVKGKSAADGPRYKALGNSMAVPVMRWLGERIQMLEDIMSEISNTEAA